MIGKYNYFIVLMIILTLLLSACWDQRLLRDHSLVLAIGFDREDENHIKKTVTFPKVTNEIASATESEASESLTLTAIGNTVRDTERELDSRMPQKFDRSKARVVIFGKELAREGIYSTLDSIFRDLRAPVNAYLAVYNGEAEDALNIKPEQALMVSETYADLLTTAEQTGITKNELIQLSGPKIRSKGSDLVLPYLSYDEESKEAIVDGAALFFTDKMTGSLNNDEATMYLILSKQIKKNAELNFKVHDTEEDPQMDYVNISYRKTKRKIDIDTTNNDVHVNIDLTLEVEVEEYAADHLYDVDKVKELEKKIEENANQLAKETIIKMQEANSDALGIGKRVKAYHHNTWKKIDWIKKYPDIDIDVDFEVDIVRHGITN